MEWPVSTQFSVTVILWMPTASWHCSHHPKTVASAVWKSSTYIWTYEGLHHHHIPTKSSSLVVGGVSPRQDVCLHCPWEHPPDCVEAIHWAWEVSSKPEWMVLFRSSMCFLFLLVQQYNDDKDWGVCQHSINWDGKSPRKKMTLWRCAFLSPVTLAGPSR